MEIIGNRRKNKLLGFGIFLSFSIPSPYLCNNQSFFYKNLNFSDIIKESLSTQVWVMILAVDYQKYKHHASVVRALLAIHSSSLSFSCSGPVTTNQVLQYYYSHQGKWPQEKKSTAGGDDNQLKPSTSFFNIAPSHDRNADQIQYSFSVERSIFQTFW